MSRNYLFNIDYVSTLQDFDSLVKIQNDIKQYLPDEEVYIVYLSPSDDGLRARFFNEYNNDSSSVLENLGDNSFLIKSFQNYNSIKLEIRLRWYSIKNKQFEDISYINYLKAHKPYSEFNDNFTAEELYHEGIAKITKDSLLTSEIEKLKGFCEHIIKFKPNITMQEGIFQMEQIVSMDRTARMTSKNQMSFL